MELVSWLSMMIVDDVIAENTAVHIDAGPTGSGLVYRLEKHGIVDVEASVIKFD